jgi:hypothetical protein
MCAILGVETRIDGCDGYALDGVFSLGTWYTVLTEFDGFPIVKPFDLSLQKSMASAWSGDLRAALRE